MDAVEEDDARDAYFTGEFVADCCNSRMSTYLAGLETPNTTECLENIGWGMDNELDIRNTAESTLETTYNDYCVSTSSAGETENCGSDTDYTTYRAAYLAVMKATKEKELVTKACTDWDTLADGAGLTYDCTNGDISNGGSAYTTAGATDVYFHLVNVAATAGASGDEANNDLVYLYYT